MELVSCLGSPNPELRDQIGYELFTHWLREDKLTDASRRSLLTELSANLTAEQPLLRSFSALILAELMRSDANRAFMTPAERDSLLTGTAKAIEVEQDFRGLEAGLGWVHPVAHLADLLWRFALHPETSSGQASQVLDAVRTKVAPTDISYSHNEGDRLARAVSTLIQRKMLDPEVAGEWISSYQTPVSMDQWSDAFRSPAGMTELHNTKQFLRALSDQLSGVELDARISEPLTALVNGFTQLI